MEEKQVKLTGQQVSQMHQIEATKLEAYNRRIEVVQRTIIDIQAALDALKELKKEKENKIMVSLGAGAYIDATVEELKKVKVGLSGNVLIDKKPEEAESALKKMQEEAKTELEKTAKDREKVISNMLALEKIMTEVAQRRKG